VSIFIIPSDPKKNYHLGSLLKALKRIQHYLPHQKEPIMIKYIVLFFTILLPFTQAHAKGEDEGKAVINAKVVSTLSTKSGKKEISGRVSAYLRLNPADVDRGQVKVGGFNVLYSDVPQALISGRKSEIYEFGNLGFSIKAVKEGQFLEYDPQKLTLSGTIQGSTSISQFDEIYKSRGGEANDDFDTLTQDAEVKIILFLDKPLNENINSEKPFSLKGKMDMSIAVAEDRDYDIPMYRIANPDLFFVDLEIIWWPRWEIAKRLCLQPVRIGTFTFSGGWPPLISVNYSGDGLAFGLPGANKEWAKADVVFTVRDWKTIFNSQYSTLTSGEAAALRATVDDDDCVEVFFVDKFSPASMWGGGATWSGGTASTKIISSDENAFYGIDFTHLAHELGHTITLKHPGQGFPTAAQPHRIDASSGTLMCPSGFMNDNPTVNSQWNKDSVQNPLFTFSLKTISAGPDCQNDADCGACP
jgi:hypothetical protein